MIGFGMGTFTKVLPQQMDEVLPRTPGDFATLGSCILAAYAIWVLLVVAHEAGHLLAGWMVGFRFVNVRIGCLNLNHQEGWKASFIRRSLFSGTAQMRASTWNPTRPTLRYCVFILGGPAASLLCAVTLGWLGQRQTGFGATLAELAAMNAAIHFVFCILPVRGKGKRLATDGRVFCDLLTNRQRRAVLLARLTFNERLMEFRRLIAARNFQGAAAHLDVLNVAAETIGHAAMLESFARSKGRLDRIEQLRLRKATLEGITELRPANEDATFESILPRADAVLVDAGPVS